MSAVGVAVGSDLVVWRVRAQATRLEEPNHGLGYKYAHLAPPAAGAQLSGCFYALEPHPLRRGRDSPPRPRPFVPMSAISALLESCSSAPAPRLLPSITHCNFVLDQVGIGKAAGCIGTARNALQRLYNGPFTSAAARMGLDLGCGGAYCR